MHPASLSCGHLNIANSMLFLLVLSFNAYKLYSSCSVIRASVPKMNSDGAFEQKNEIAKAVEDELEKVFVHHSLVF